MDGGKPNRNIQISSTFSFNKGIHFMEMISLCILLSTELCLYPLDQNVFHPDEFCTKFKTFNSKCSHTNTKPDSRHEIKQNKCIQLKLNFNDFLIPV